MLTWRPAKDRVVRRYGWAAIAVVGAVGWMAWSFTLGATPPRPNGSEAEAAASGGLDANGLPPRLLSAFFRLDNRLPFGANLLCLGASGEDGMPVVLSHAIDPDSLQAEDFRVVRRSGVESTPMGARPSSTPADADAPTCGEQAPSDVGSSRARRQYWLPG